MVFALPDLYELRRANKEFHPSSLDVSLLEPFNLCLRYPLDQFDRRPIHQVVDRESIYGVIDLGTTDRHVGVLPIPTNS